MLALIGGLVTGIAVDSKKAGMIVGGGLALIALFYLYMNGKEDRSKVEAELNRLPPEEQAYWRPALDNPAIIPMKLQERMSA